MNEYIQFHNVDFQYSLSGRNSDWILKDFNLSIGKGEFYMLLGPSGCGKTTVINLLAGFEHPTQGKVDVSGQVITESGVDRVVIFQSDDSLYPWLTALENVGFGLRVAGMSRDERRKEAYKYLALVGLEGQGGKFPSELSGGMKQRVQLARALVSHTGILLMDEPFGALDAQTRGILQIELEEILKRAGCTVLFVTHDIAEAILLADNVGIMTTGPGATIKETIEIDLPRPRSIADPEFGQIYKRLTNLLSLQSGGGR